MVNDTLLSGQVHFTGLGSNTDFDSIVEKLVGVEARKKKQLESWKSSWSDKIKAFKELSTSMVSMSTALKTMDTRNEFVVKNVASSNQTAISATAAADALEGSHSVSVTQLAQNNVIYGNTVVATATATDLTGGADKVFAYTYKGTTQTITVPNGTTLDALVNRINTYPGNPGVRAELLKITDTDYRLKLVGLDLGQGKDITIEPTTTLAGFGPGTYTVAQASQNAKFTMDGVPLERSSNVIADAVKGLTLTLNSSPATASLNVTTDKAAIKENIRKFVKQVNDVRVKLQQLTKVDSVSNKGSILTGNYGLDIIGQKLKNVAAARGVGFDGNTDPYSVLAQVGVTTDASEGSSTRGLLLLDEAKLDEALTKNIDAVTKLFSTYYEGTSDSTNFIYGSYLKGTSVAGEYPVNYTVSGGTVTGTIGGSPAAYDSTTKQLTSLDGPSKGISIQINNLNDGTYTGNVALKLGKVGEMDRELATLTSATDGPLHILEDNYNYIIKDIDKKIDYETRRLDKYQKNLKLRFARLETILNKYQGVQNSLNNAIKQLGSGGGSS